MHAKKIAALSIVCYLLLTKTATAQDSTTTTTGKTELTVSLTYNSGMNYYGRVDSLKSTGFYPYLGINFKNGLFVNSTFVFTHNSVVTDYAATLLTGGYNFKNKQDSWAGTLSASYYLYNEQSELVQSAVKAEGNFSISNLNKIINTTVGINTKYSNQFDFGAQVSLDHIVRIEHPFGNNHVIVIDPGAAVYAGTQNFTKTYYEERNFLIFPLPDQEVTENSRQFNILSYELSVPVIYGIGKFNLVFNPAYVLPQNVIIVPGRPDLSERAENLFYFTLTGKFTF
jgi:hypothetical protein